jgi:hypothetical protein
MKIEEPKLLTDKSRLREIFDLRVRSYENSPYAQYINYKNAPNGLFDHLDNSDYSHHWIIESDHKIIASCRLCMISDLKDILESFSILNLPQMGNYAFYSRLVVAKEFRNLGLSHLMDKTRIEFIKTQKSNFLTLALARKDRVRALIELGFEYISTVKVKMVDQEEVATALKLRHPKY